MRNEDKEIHSAADRILKEYNLTSISDTFRKGMSYIAPDALAGHSYRSREVYDVSGAGDTVVATLAAALAAGIPIADAIYLANKAAGIVVGKNRHQPHSVQRVAGRATNRETGQQTYSYFPTCRYYKTTACAGAQNHIHKRLLRHSAQRTRVLSGKGQKTGDVLIVGLNSDSSVKRLKGESHPINDENARSTVLAALEAVDYVVIFTEDTR